jgi:hypothetical protein
VSGDYLVWGDMHYPTTPLTQQEWYDKRDWILNTYLPQRTGIVLQQFRNYGLYPNINPPTFNQNGGPVSVGFNLTMTNPNGSGTIYYTLDGADPRLPGGSVNTAHAVSYTKAVTLNKTTCVKARVKSTTTWSALNEAIFAVGPLATTLLLTQQDRHPML